jgi:hypothetical protein
MGLFVYYSRRRELRRAIKLTCNIVRERDFRHVGGRAIDLSPTGMLAIVDNPVAVGETVIVSFCATELGLWFDTDARITRVVRGRRAGDPPREAVGLEFGSLEAVSRLILRGYLRRLRPPVPKRAPAIDYAATVRRLGLGGCGAIALGNRPTAS